MNEPADIPINWALMEALKIMYPNAKSNLHRWDLYLINRPIIKHGMDRQTAAMYRADWREKEIEKLKI